MPDQRRGTLSVLGAWSIWGLFPLYWPLLEPAGAMEILANRISWSLIVIIGLLVLRRRTAAFIAIWRSRRVRTAMLTAAVLISLNWFTYIWGVNNGFVVEAALGYYINPLVTVALGVIFFGDRLRFWQKIALVVATAAVVELSIDVGHPPWISLVLAISFGAYGATKKTAAVGPVEGLAFETCVMAPIAIGYLIWLASQGQAEGFEQGPAHILLLATSGIITVIPLLLFASAANSIPLSTIGLTQYLTPTLQFGIGVLVYHEAMSTGRWIGFVMVWAALAMISVDTIRGIRQGRSQGWAPEAVEADSVLDAGCSSSPHSGNKSGH